MRHSMFSKARLLATLTVSLGVGGLSYVAYADTPAAPERAADRAHERSSERSALKSEKHAKQVTATGHIQPLSQWIRGEAGAGIGTGAGFQPLGQPQPGTQPDLQQEDAPIGGQEPQLDRRDAGAGVGATARLDAGLGGDEPLVLISSEHGAVILSEDRTGLMAMGWNGEMGQDQVFGVEDRPTPLDRATEPGLDEQPAAPGTGAVQPDATRARPGTTGAEATGEKVRVSGTLYQKQGIKYLEVNSIASADAAAQPGAGLDQPDADTFGIPRAEEEPAPLQQDDLGTQGDQQY